ncbi:PREDICTED: NF-kappa-B inhibitor-interacting Ras-like protein 2 isoform X1 [Priapulus caudatus]|uniref:NF-kappa-B inhibitor-interacting Ras-like protein 2 isoform X1 n=1 Tax=Priapulus caudatus TaxID=37621 RepID=A0ABM1EQY3_PRICU|nr:PREDICTED: NF-kappa-B inhibitor-interacting Ras-like protein 2 isoform X1 [Priapulus caudatus]
MPKIPKVVICGLQGTGKTAILEQLIYGNHKVGSEVDPTIEDVYVANIETDRGTKEKIRFYDTAGLNEQKVTTLKHLFSSVDGVILVYSVTDTQSFKKLDILRKEVDRAKDKKELPVIVLANKSDLTDERIVDKAQGEMWAARERIKHYEVTAADRRTLTEPFVFLTSKLTQPPNKSSFPTASQLARKITSKGEPKAEKNVSEC